MYTYFLTWLDLLLQSFVVCQNSDVISKVYLCQKSELFSQSFNLSQKIYSSDLCYLTILTYNDIRFDVFHNFYFLCQDSDWWECSFFFILISKFWKSGIYEIVKFWITSKILFKRIISKHFEIMHQNWDNKSKFWHTNSAKNKENNVYFFLFYFHM